MGSAYKCNLLLFIFLKVYFDLFGAYFEVSFSSQEGKQRHFALGSYVRGKYTGFLSDTYSPDEIVVRSTDVDRTLMSAQSHLAGLYPPIGNQTWNKDLKWQPIPVHTIPKAEGEFL